jgi:hypothetical protein
MKIKIINEAYSFLTESMEVFLENVQRNLSLISKDTGLDSEKIMEISKRISPDYWQWVLRNWAEKRFNTDPETQENITNILGNFRKLKNRMTSTNDIYKYKDIDEINNVVSKYFVDEIGANQINVKKRLPMEKVLSMKGVRQVKQDGPYTTIEITDKNSLEELGEGSNSWCTRKSYGLRCRSDESIIQYGKVYMVLENGAPVVQYSPTYDQIQDINDRFIQVGGKIASIIIPPDFSKSDDERIYNYVENVIGNNIENAPEIVKENIKKNPDLFWAFSSDEEIQKALENPKEKKKLLKGFMSSQEIFGNYGSDIGPLNALNHVLLQIKKPLSAKNYLESTDFTDVANILPKPVIEGLRFRAKMEAVKVPEYALRLAKDDEEKKNKILLNRAEKYISKVPYMALDYAQSNGKRWSGVHAKKAEESIASNPQTAKDYAFYVLEKEWDGPSKDLATRAMFTSPVDLAEYISYVLKKPWPEAEKFIKNNAEASVIYAEIKDKRTFEEGEDAISRSAPHSYRYALMRGQRFPKGEKTISLDGDLAAKYAIDVLKGEWDGELKSETEDRIINSPNAYNYFNLINKRSEKLDDLLKGEKILTSSSDDLFDYIIKTRKERFPEFENTSSFVKFAKKNPKKFAEYVKNLVKGRDSSIEKIASSDEDLALTYAKDIIGGEWDGENAESALETINKGEIRNIINYYLLKKEYDESVEEKAEQSLLNKKNNEYETFDNLSRYIKNFKGTLKNEKLKSLIKDYLEKDLNPNESWIEDHKKVEALRRYGELLGTRADPKFEKVLSEVMDNLKPGKNSPILKNLIRYHHDTYSKNLKPEDKEEFDLREKFLNKHIIAGINYDFIKSDEENEEEYKNFFPTSMVKERFKGRLKSNKDAMVAIQELLKHYESSLQVDEKKNEEYKKKYSELKKFYDEEMNQNAESLPNENNEKENSPEGEKTMFTVEKKTGDTGNTKEEIDDKKTVGVNEEAKYMRQKLFKNLREMAFAKEGLASNLTVEEVAKKHGVDEEVIKDQLEKGMKVELEHTSDLDKARDIALDHLVEIPDYYDRLLKMEDEAKAELHEAMLLLTEEEKVIKNELEKAKDFFGGKKVEGIDTNRFVRLWNSIKGQIKMSLHTFIKLLNPLNWPKAIFMRFYSIVKSIATLGTKENQELRVETSKLLVDIADGKYKGKSASEIFKDYNKIREKYGFKPYSFLQEGVIREDFNGQLNRDFEGNVIDIELEEELNESFFKNIGLKFLKTVIDIMPNQIVDNILTDVVKNSKVENVDLSKLKSIKRNSKINLIKALINKTIETGKESDKRKIAKIEKESEKIIMDAKKEETNVINNATKDTVKAVGTSMRNVALGTIIGPLVAAMGILPAIVVGSLIATNAHEAIINQFK